MRVLHVIPSMSAKYGGPSRAMVEIERALAKLGHGVTTVTTDADGEGRAPVACDKPVAVPFATRWYFRRQMRRYTVSCGLAGWLRRNVRSFDVVHAHALFSFPPVAAAIIAGQAGVPYILRPHGVLAKYGMTRRRPFLKKLSLMLVEKRLIESAAAVHFTSETEREEAATLGLRFRAAVIPLGIEAEPHSAEQTAVPGSCCQLLFLSRLDPVKNVENLLRAFMLVRSKNPNIELTIAGGGHDDYVATLKTLADALGASPFVRWAGHLNGSQKSSAMRSADLFVLPSYSENFGVAAVEALIAGLPCIVASGVAIAREIEAGEAGIVTGTDPASIAAAIERLAENPALRRSMSAAASRLAADVFSTSVMGRRLDELYRDVAARRRTAA